MPLSGARAPQIGTRVAHAADSVSYGTERAATVGRPVPERRADATPLPETRQARGSPVVRSELAVGTDLRRLHLMGSGSRPGGVTSAELTFLRAVLLYTWSVPEELADAAGLAALDAAEAAERLVRLGALSRRPGDGFHPNFEEATCRSLAARAAITPICWARERNVPRDPREVRATFADHVRLWGRIPKDRLDRINRLEGDARRAAALLLPGASGFEMGHWFTDIVNAAYLFEPSAWSLAAECFAKGSLRRTIGHSLAAERTLPGLPPMLLVDHSRTNCSVCRLSVDWSEGQHTTVPGSRTAVERGCGVVWTHFTIRAWLAEANGWVGANGDVRKRMDRLEELPGLEWFDP
jgi:hypothetical protein